MASRVLYGLGKQGSVPAIFARVHRLTRTPLIATGTITAAVLALALAFPLEGLAGQLPAKRPHGADRSPDRRRKTHGCSPGIRDGHEDL